MLGSVVRAYKEKNPIRAVLFDLGGTLVQTTEIPRVYKRILEAHGVKSSLREISVAHEETEKYLDVQELAILFEEYWIRWNLQILKRLKIRNNIEALAQTIAEQWWNYSDINLYPDVMQTLKQLRDMGLKTGLVTNGLENDYREILRKTGLSSFFDVTVGIDTVGRMKPHKDIFLHAVDKLEVLPAETLFIGDRLEEDYKGSRKAGLRPLLIDRDQIIHSDVEKIADLREIINRLA